MTEYIGPLRPRQYLLLLMSLALLWPAIINRGPFFFADTSAYVRGVDAGMVRLVGHRTIWTSGKVEQVAGASPRTSRAGGTIKTASVPSMIMLGRSVYYGLLLYIGVLAGSLWLSLLIQALLIGGTLIGFLRHFVRPEDEVRFAWCAVALFAATCFTTAPYFVSMLLPDIFAGAAIIAAAALILGWERETVAGRTGWTLLCILSALTHTSHILILIGMAGIGAIITWLRKTPSVTRGVAFVAVAALIGTAGDAAVAASIKAITHRDPVRPPFITARLIDDGPGVAYLKAHCHREHWLLCQYRDRLPINSDAFLWHTDPHNGVFNTLDPADRVRLSAEQMPFVIAVVRNDPIGVAKSSISAISRQFAAHGLGEFNYVPQVVDDFAQQLPGPVAADLRRSAAAADAMPVIAIQDIAEVALLLALTLILAALSWRSTRSAALYGLVVICGWAIDNIVCGALSTPHSRYQERVTWAVIASAILIVARQLAYRQRRQFDDGVTKRSDGDDQSCVSVVS